jgi:hypothetical protein
MNPYVQHPIMMDLIGEKGRTGDLLMSDLPLHEFKNEIIMMKDVGKIQCVKFTISLKRAFYFSNFDIQQTKDDSTIFSINNTSYWSLRCPNNCYNIICRKDENEGYDKVKELFTIDENI